MNESPIAPSGNGRDVRGRFTKGNPGGSGNPFARRVAALRSTLIREVTRDDIRAIVRKLIEQARAGDIAAAKEVLLRTLGRPVESDLLERLEALEEMALEVADR